MIAVGQNMRVSNTVTAIALNLARFCVDVDFEIKTSSQLNLFFKLGCSDPAIHVTHFSLVDMERVNHTGTKKPVISPLYKFGVWPYPV